MSAPAAGPFRILVVEDEEEIRRLIEQVLTGAGYAVRATGEPKQAVALAIEMVPDLVLCDLAMPEMDGHAVLRALRDEPQTAGCPVMFVTAHREFSERVEAFKLGVVDYLAKPFPHDVLLRKVEKVLASRASEPGSVPSQDSRRVIVRRGADAPTGAQGKTTSEDPLLGYLPDEPASQDPSALPGGPADVSFEALPGAFRRILVVDDNEEFRDYLRRLMESHDFVVHEAAGGETALALALEHKPWLILSDVAMPGMDGIELCRAVRRHSLIAHTPVIFLSGWDDYRDRDRGLEAGADEFVSKHTPARELLIRIQLVLGRYARLSTGDEKAAGMEGRIALVGAAGVLQMCNLGRLTGRLEAESGGSTAEVLFREGEIVGVMAAGSSGEAALLEYLSWTEGRFNFSPAAVGDAPAMGETFSQLLLDACRKLDERAR
jgi:DNA-binding response OmpR family regulator